MSEMRTVSGLVPERRKAEPYNITTMKAEAFLQKKFDAIIQIMNKEIRKHNQEHPDEKPIPYQDPVEVNLITTRMSQKFYPFVLMLPSSVLENKNQYEEGDELDIFNPQHSEKNARIKEPLYKIIQPFFYDDNDRKAFYSQNFQHTLKISHSTADALKVNCRLRIHHFAKESVTYVAVLLDPLRLFHNMLTSTDDNTPFSVFIDRVDQMKGGDFRYSVLRSPKDRNNKKRHKGGLDIEKAIVRRINGR